MMERIHASILLLLIGISQVSEAWEIDGCGNNVTTKDPLTIYDSQGNVRDVVDSCFEAWKYYPEECSRTVDNMDAGDVAVGGIGGRCCRRCCKNHLSLNNTLMFNGKEFSQCRQLVAKYPEACLLHGYPGQLCCKRCHRIFKSCPLVQPVGPDSYTCNIRQEYSDCRHGLLDTYNHDANSITPLCMAKDGTKLGKLDGNCYRCIGSNVKEGCHLQIPDYVLMLLNISHKGLDGDTCMSFEYCHDDATGKSNLVSAHMISSGKLSEIKTIGNIIDCGKFSYTLKDFSEEHGLLLLGIAPQPEEPVKEACYVSISPVKFTKGPCEE